MRYQILHCSPSCDKNQVLLYAYHTQWLIFRIVKYEAWQAVDYVGLQIQGFTALVKRGNCTFTTKARVAQAAGAVAILVVNDKQGLLHSFFLSNSHIGWGLSCSFTRTRLEC